MIAKWAETLRVFIWFLSILLLFTPMILEAVFVSDILPIAQRIFPFWEDRSAPLLLSDLFFIEGAVFLVFGALIGGVTLYNAWAALDVRKVQFTEYVWNLRQMRKDRNFPTGLIAGLAVIAVGIIYILAAILV
jgi:hypothetical protein